MAQLYPLVNKPVVTRLFSIILAGAILGYYIPVRVPIFGLVFGGVRIFIIGSVILAIFTLWEDSNIATSYADLGLIITWLFLISSVAWSYAPITTARVGTDLLFYLAFYLSLIVYFYRDPNQKIIFSSLLLVTIVLIIIGVIEFSQTSLTRGIFGVSRNIYARNIAGLFPLLPIYSYYSSCRKRYIFFVLSVVSIILVALSGSRSGFVAILFAVLILGFIYILTRSRSTQKWALGILLISIVLVSFTFKIGLESQILPSRLTRIPLSPAAFNPEVLGGDRYLIYQAEVAAIRQYWVTGMGYGAFEVWSSAEFGIPSHQAHDLITRIWLGSGIGAVLMFFITYGLILRNYLRSIITDIQSMRPYYFAALLGLLSITLTGLANIVIIEPLFYIWLAIGSNGIIQMTIK